MDTSNVEHLSILVFLLMMKERCYFFVNETKVINHHLSLSGNHDFPAPPSEVCPGLDGEPGEQGEPGHDRGNPC